jgi:NAD(P)-dependent dehydrogenase (short-subunit alcohol dehydrogenase family)
MPVGTRITTPFGATTTATEAAEGLDLRGRRAVVTGAGSGIGTETARVLAAAGAEVVLAVRNEEQGAAAAAEIGERARVARLDLADLDSVRAFASSWDGPLHILVNNAGVMASPLARTARGWEMQFATNHLGHFALATGLLPALRAEGARVVSVSSRGHLRCDVDLDDLFFQQRPYDPRLAYGQSKTANILFAVEAYRRWRSEGIEVNSLHPGAIAETNLSRHMSRVDFDAAIAAAGFVKNTAQGAATSVLLAASPLLAGVGGRYFEDCNEALPHTPEMSNGVAAYALDPDHAEALWEASTRLVQS